MTDYIDRQVAIDTFHAFAPGIPWDTLDKIFNEIPSADAFEVVRCKDCRNYVCDGVMVCIRFEDASLNPDDYCSYGERK